jgi:hypothetical protein
MRSLLACSLVLSFAAGPAFGQESPDVPPEPVPAAVDSTPKTNPAFELLEQAYYLGGQLPADQHAYQMGALVIVASKMKHPTLRQWAHETIQLTQGLPQGGMRTPTEQGALSALVDVDPAEAIRMLILLPPPTLTQVERAGARADYRTVTARTVFPRYWKGVKTPDVGLLRSVADHLGRTGDYPFGALSQILGDVNEKDPALAQMLFLDALQYYQLDQPKTYGFHAQFVVLLHAVQKILPEPMMRSAMEASVSKLLKAAAAPLPSDMIYVGRIASGDGLVELQSPAEETLFKLLPLVRQFSPDLESQILEERSGLGRIIPSIGALPPDYSEISTIIEQNPEKRAEWLARIENQTHAKNAKRLAATDPETALRLASQITDSSMRDSTLVAIAQGKLKETDPAQAAKLLAEANASTPQSDSTSQTNWNRLVPLLDSARGFAQSHDPELWNTIKRGLELAEELFVEEQRNSKTPYVNYATSPDWTGPLYGGPDTAFIPTVQLIKIGMEKETANTMGWLAQQHDSLLKSFLLVAAADALWVAQRRRPESAEGAGPVEEKVIILR